MTLDDEVLSFLRKYGHLDNMNRTPDFTGKAREGFTNPLMRHPWIARDPVLAGAYSSTAMTGDEVYASRFKGFNLPLMKLSDFKQKASVETPDDSSYVVIDIGSHLGRRITRPFARSHPNVQVFMFDKLSYDNIMEPFNFKKVERTDIAGEELQKNVPINKSDVEGSINALLEANNYPNITYIHRHLN